MRAVAAFQVGAMLLALAVVGHHRATGHGEPRIAASGDAGTLLAAASAADRHDCQLCRASHVRYVAGAAVPTIECRLPSHVATIAYPEGDAPVLVASWLIAPKTSPPV